MTKNSLRGIPVEVGDKLRSGGILIEVTEMPEEGYFFSAKVLESERPYTGSGDCFYKASWFADTVQLTKSAECFRTGELVCYECITVMVTGPGAVPGYDFSGVVIRLDSGYAGRMTVGEHHNDFSISAYTRLTTPVEVMGIKPAYPFGVGDLVKRNSFTNADFVIRVTEMNSDPFDYPDRLFAGTIIAREGDDQTYVGETREAFYISDFARVRAVTKYEFMEDK